MKKITETIVDLHDEADKYYRNYCKNNNVVYQEPVRSATKAGRKYVVLHNSYGEVARYLLKEKKLLLPDGTMA